MLMTFKFCERLWPRKIGNKAPTRVLTCSRHQMETFSALLAICAGNSSVPGEFPTQRPVMRSFDVYFDLRPNKRLSKHSWGWWFETQSRPLWRHRNGIWYFRIFFFHAFTYTNSCLISGPGISIKATFPGMADYIVLHFEFWYKLIW